MLFSFKTVYSDSLTEEIFTSDGLNVISKQTDGEYEFRNFIYNEVSFGEKFKKSSANFSLGVKNTTSKTLTFETIHNGIADILDNHKEIEVLAGYVDYSAGYMEFIVIYKGSNVSLISVLLVKDRAKYDIKITTVTTDADKKVSSIKEFMTAEELYINLPKF